MKELKFNGEKASAEVADTFLKRGIGLSLRTKGKMLFKFEKEVNLPIDMMLMRKPLHLYFMNSDKKVIYVEKADPWYKLPENFFHSPEQSYRYLLESFEELNIGKGDKIDF